MQSIPVYFCGYVIPLSITLSVGAIIFVLLMNRWFLRIGALPNISEARLRIDAFDLPSFQWFRGSLVVFNTGLRRCQVTYVRIQHDTLWFQTSKITEQSEMDMTLWVKGKIDSLDTSPVNADENKTIFFGGFHEIETLEELPDNLTLEVYFDCRKEPLRYNLTRHSEVKTYGLYTFGAARTRQTSRETTNRQKPTAAGSGCQYESSGTTQVGI